MIALPFMLLSLLITLAGAFGLIALIVYAFSRMQASAKAASPYQAAASSGGLPVNNFSAVGRRLRRFKIAAFFPFTLAVIIITIGIAAYIDHGPPMHWVTDNTGFGHYQLLAPDEPEYVSAVHNRWTDLILCSLWGSGFLTLAALLFAASRKAPSKEVLLLAQSKKGLLTLSEITTTLDIDPNLAARALRQLQKHKIASPRWQEIRKNLWEFPDYQDLPLDQTLELAQARGGRLTVDDLTAAGQSRETAKQTLATLTSAGLVKEDPAAPAPAVLLQPQ